MKRLKDYDDSIKASYAIPTSLGTLDLGNGCLGWTHESDLETLESVQWTSKSHKAAESTLEQLKAAKGHPSFIELTAKSASCNSKGTDEQTDFSSAKDFVFILDPFSFATREGGKKTITGSFLDVSAAAPKIVKSIEMDMQDGSPSTSEIVKRLIVEHGGRILHAEDQDYYVLPSDAVKYPFNTAETGKYMFTVDWRKILGDKIKLNNEIYSGGTDIYTYVIPVKPLKDYQVTKLD